VASTLEIVDLPERGGRDGGRGGPGGAWRTGPRHRPRGGRIRPGRAAHLRRRRNLRRLGVLDASECPPTFGTPPDMVVGVIAGGYQALVKSKRRGRGRRERRDGGDRSARVAPADFVLGIAASVRRRSSARALARAQTIGATTGLVSCSDPRRCSSRPATSSSFQRSARSSDGVHTHEGRYGHEAGPQHTLDRRDDPAGTGLRQPHGGLDGHERQAAGTAGNAS